MRDSDWLSAAGEYQDLISKLCSSDPRLRSRCSKNIAQQIPWPNPHARLVMLENDNTKAGTFGSPVQHTSASLKEHLSAQPAPQPGAGRVFILEGLHPEYIAVLGAHCKMHPAVFIDQERTVVISPKTQNSSDFFSLPSSVRTAEHLTMKYYELLSLPQKVVNFRMCCAETGRHIGMTRIKGELLDVGVVRRKCTIWNKKYPDGGWDCLILTDPPLRAVMTSKVSGYTSSKLSYTTREKVHISSSPFQNGYLDFTPHSTQLTTLRGPPRTCLLDDLAFYLQTHPLFPPGTPNPSTPGPPNPSLPPIPSPPTNTPAIFAQKIIASHYLQLFTFIRSVTSDVQFQMSRLDRMGMDYFDTTFVESGQWSDAQALERRISEYTSDMESLMLGVGIPLDDKPDVPGCISPVVASGTASTIPWYDTAADLQVLRMRFCDVRRHAEMLNAAITGLTSISGNQKALREARSTKALTLVGLVFIPLAYTATLFSMTESFGPGGERFWVYFAVSVPLIVCVLGAYTVLDRFGDRILERVEGFGVSRRR
ncbi:hypothetical protein QBC34DRAFT_349219 [Podospora aff. communis PSN243]|uniref:Uncharacterized protein n=1 Tax=Podospora aff. communis PSN243 TaxID=3040156 RepID=A0AAV9GS29_9PEZI|nr:hypothetical protein QBC34DRAFT_349219 [Podospora aff. communis PSN243]